MIVQYSNLIGFKNIKKALAQISQQSSEVKQFAGRRTLSVFSDTDMRNKAAIQGLFYV